MASKLVSFLLLVIIIVTSITIYQEYRLIQLNQLGVLTVTLWHNATATATLTSTLTERARGLPPEAVYENLTFVSYAWQDTSRYYLSLTVENHFILPSGETTPIHIIYYEVYEKLPDNSTNLFYSHGIEKVIKTGRTQFDVAIPGTVSGHRYSVCLLSILGNRYCMNDTITS